jgi:CrcB protein
MTNTYLGQLLVVGTGGFLGSAARYALSGLVHRGLPSLAFPVGTLAVNVLGCLIIGFLGGLLETRQILGPSQRLFLLIGVLGGFTTFSTFSYETLGLLHAAEFAKSLLNVMAHVGIGLFAAWVGYLGAQYL